MDNIFLIATCENDNCERTENCYRKLLTNNLKPMDFKNICFSPDYSWYWHYENQILNQNNNTEPVTETENTETKGE